MDEILNPNNAEHFSKVALYFGAVIGLGGLLWLGYQVVKFIGNRILAILNAVLEVLKRLEIAVEVLQKNAENSEKRLTRLEDHVYSNLTKAAKR